MDTTPIAERLRRIRSSLKHLHELQNTSRDEFVSNYLISSTVERQFQVAIQAATDIGQIILAELGETVPKNYADVFTLVGQVGVCSPDLSRRLVHMARFRNVLVHLYLDVDPDKVYDALQNSLPDLEEYANGIAAYVQVHGTPEK
jgi:uncharacterized protein YutE (UPF0331/DUF86 family)